jgi:uncharacterized protein
MANQHVPNTFDYIEFPVTDASGLARSRAFFGDVFGWTYQNWGEGYSDTQDSGVSSGLNGTPEHCPTYPLVVIYADDLETVREKVLAAKGTVTRDIFSFPGGRRFHFTEPGGNELAAWSDREKM